METPQAQREGLAAILASSQGRSPRSRVLDAVATPASRGTDESILMTRLREAGLDVESVKRWDKASLIAYIAEREAELSAYQYQMGLLILEKKEWTSKYEQLKAASDSADIAHRLEQAAHLSALAEAKKHEDSLKMALGIEKECVANIEKTLREIRAEYAESKVAADSKMAEARNMLEDAQKKFSEAEIKMCSVESLQEDANRYRRAAERKLQEVEEREDDVRRRLTTFKSECEEEKNKISLERQSLSERLKRVQQEQEKLLDGQALLNQREEYVLGRSQELSRLGKELEASKLALDTEFEFLKEEKTKLEQNMATLIAREQAVNKREALLENKEQELLLGMEKLSSREHDETQRLVAKQEATLLMRKSELEAEMSQKMHSIEQEMESKRRVLELREVDLSDREKFIQEKEHELEVQSRILLENDKDVTQKLQILEEKEKNLTAVEKAIELEKMHIKKETEDLLNMRLETGKSANYLEKLRKEVKEAEEKLEESKIERSELMILETKLKEEIDSVRAQKLDLLSEADELKAQKSKFESEWELIDEKRYELQKETDRIFEEKECFSKFLKEERDSLRLEKEALRHQFKQEVESLSQEQGAFISKNLQEHSEWFNKIQQDRAILIQDMELQKRELEISIRKRQEEVDGHFREKEEAFEKEKLKEYQYIESLKEAIAKEHENIVVERKKLDGEKLEISQDRERWEEELVELKRFIEELESHREKLKEQRELLNADRERIDIQIQQLNHLEDLKTASERVDFIEMPVENVKSLRKKPPTKEIFKSRTAAHDIVCNLHESKEDSSDCLASKLRSKEAQEGFSPPVSTPFSWIKRCTEMIFKLSPDKLSYNHTEKSHRNALEESNHSQLQPEYSKGTSYTFEQQILNEKNQIDKILSEVQPMKSIAEDRFTELRSADESAKNDECSMDPEPEADTKENHIFSHPEQELPARKKRANNYSSPNNVDGAPLEQKQKRKKRRQNSNALEVLSKNGASSCGTSSQTNIAANESGLASPEDTPIHCDSTNNHELKEKILKGSVESTSNAAAAAAQADKTAFLKSFTSASDHNNVQGSGSDEHLCSLGEANGSKVGILSQEVRLEPDENPECT
ncbi:hypothetical protein Sjap_017859 [Stephania japonica]|uniref:Nuclear matrix constituent protein 1-like protein n=1 Tax=Stephania japonica TaxID=461633 RepID=A0AAP0I6X9_9MAGN